MAWMPDYTTLEQLKSFRRIDDGLDDVELADAIAAASRAIDDHCNRQFGQLDTVAQWAYTARADTGRGVWVVDIDDLQDTTGMVVEVSGVGVVVVAGYRLEPANAVAKGKAYTRLVVKADSSVQPSGLAYEMLITARWGWTSVLRQVKNACNLQASRFASRRDSPYGIAGSPADGSEMRLLARVDPDVGVSLRGLVRPRAVG